MLTLLIFVHHYHFIIVAAIEILEKYRGDVRIGKAINQIVIGLAFILIIGAAVQGVDLIALLIKAQRRLLIAIG